MVESSKIILSYGKIIPHLSFAIMNQTVKSETQIDRLAVRMHLPRRRHYWQPHPSSEWHGPWRKRGRAKGGAPPCPSYWLPISCPHTTCHCRERPRHPSALALFPLAHFLQCWRLFEAIRGCKQGFPTDFL